MTIRVRAIVRANAAQPRDEAVALENQFEFATPRGARLVQVIESSFPGQLLDGRANLLAGGDRRSSSGSVQVAEPTPRSDDSNLPGVELPAPGVLQYRPTVPRRLQRIVRTCGELEFRSTACVVRWLPAAGRSWSTTAAQM